MNYTRTFVKKLESLYIGNKVQNYMLLCKVIVIKHTLAVKSSVRVVIANV